VFFYHSNCKPPGIVGLMEVVDLNIIDPTQFDQDSKYFDPKSKNDNPRWDCVKVKFIYKSNKILSLPELKILFEEDDLLVVKKGNRLSILPVRNDVAKMILEKI
jgi:predicted RNA-binding protein with PUA-like domain